MMLPPKRNCCCSTCCIIIWILVALLAITAAVLYGLWRAEVIDGPVWFNKWMSSDKPAGFGDAATVKGAAAPETAAAASDKTSAAPAEPPTSGTKTQANSQAASNATKQEESSPKPVSAVVAPPKATAEVARPSGPSQAFLAFKKRYPSSPPKKNSYVSPRPVTPTARVKPYKKRLSFPPPSSTRPASRPTSPSRLHTLSGRISPSGRTRPNYNAPSSNSNRYEYKPNFRSKHSVPPSASTNSFNKLLRGMSGYDRQNRKDNRYHENGRRSRKKSTAQIRGANKERFKMSDQLAKSARKYNHAAPTSWKKDSQGIPRGPGYWKQRRGY